MANNTNCGGDNFDDESDVYYELGVATLVCGIWGNYDFGAEMDEVFLWYKEAGVYRCDGDYDDCGDGDDATDNFVLLWAGVAD